MQTHSDPTIMAEASDPGGELVRALKLKHVVGAGASAVVVCSELQAKKLSKLPAHAPKFLALKLCLPPESWGHPTAEERQNEQCFMAEADTMMQLRCPHIIQCIGVTELPKGTRNLPKGYNEGATAMLLEWMEAGSVARMVVKQMTTSSRLYTDRQALEVLLDVASGLLYLHNQSPPLVHRDMKLENLLLTRKNGRLECKIADLGLHAVLDRTAHVSLLRRKAKCAPPPEPGRPPRVFYEHTDPQVTYMEEEDETGVSVAQDTALLADLQGFSRANTLQPSDQEGTLSASSGVPPEDAVPSVISPQSTSEPQPPGSSQPQQPKHSLQHTSAAPATQRSPGAASLQGAPEVAVSTAGTATTAGQQILQRTESMPAVMPGATQPSGAPSPSPFQDPHTPPRASMALPDDRRDSISIYGTPLTEAPVSEPVHSPVQPPTVLSSSPLAEVRCLSHRESTPQQHTPEKPVSVATQVTPGLWSDVPVRDTCDAAVNTGDPEPVLVAAHCPVADTATTTTVTLTSAARRASSVMLLPEAEDSTACDTAGCDSDDAGVWLAPPPSEAVTKSRTTNASSPGASTRLALMQTPKTSSGDMMNMNPLFSQASPMSEQGASGDHASVPPGWHVSNISDPTDGATVYCSPATDSCTAAYTADGSTPARGAVGDAGTAEAAGATWQGLARSKGVPEVVAGGTIQAAAGYVMTAEQGQRSLQHHKQSPPAPSGQQQQQHSGKTSVRTSLSDALALAGSPSQPAAPTTQASSALQPAGNAPEPAAEAQPSVGRRSLPVPIPLAPGQGASSLLVCDPDHALVSPEDSPRALPDQEDPWATTAAPDTVQPGAHERHPGTSLTALQQGVELKAHTPPAAGMMRVNVVRLGSGRSQPGALSLSLGNESGVSVDRTDAPRQALDMKTQSRSSKAGLLSLESDALTVGMGPNSRMVVAAEMCDVVTDLPMRGPQRMPQSASVPDQAGLLAASLSPANSLPEPGTTATPPAEALRPRISAGSLPGHTHPAGGKRKGLGSEFSHSVPADMALMGGSGHGRSLYAQSGRAIGASGRSRAQLAPPQSHLALVGKKSLYSFSPPSPTNLGLLQESLQERPSLLKRLTSLGHQHKSQSARYNHQPQPVLSKHLNVSVRMSPPSAAQRYSLASPTRPAPAKTFMPLTVTLSNAHASDGLSSPGVQSATSQGYAGLMGMDSRGSSSRPSSHITPTQPARSGSSGAVPMTCPPVLGKTPRVWDSLPDDIAQQEIVPVLQINTDDSVHRRAPQPFLAAAALGLRAEDEPSIPSNSTGNGSVKPRPPALAIADQDCTAGDGAAVLSASPTPQPATATPAGTSAALPSPAAGAPPAATVSASPRQARLPSAKSFWGRGQSFGTPATVAVPLRRSLTSGGSNRGSGRFSKAALALTGAAEAAGSRRWQAGMQRLQSGPSPTADSAHSRMSKVLAEARRALSPEFQWVFNLTGNTGSNMYMAPEVFLHQPYNEAVDVYSFAVVMYEVMSRTMLIFTHVGEGRVAEDSDGYAKKASEGYRPSQPPGMSDDVWRLINACWAQDPLERPPMKQVVARLQTLLARMPAEKAWQGCGCLVC